MLEARRDPVKVLRAHEGEMASARMKVQRRPCEDNIQILFSMSFIYQERGGRPVERNRKEVSEREQKITSWN